jgi:hypothetical protein
MRKDDSFEGHKVNFCQRRETDLGENMAVSGPLQIGSGK